MRKSSPRVLLGLRIKELRAECGMTQEDLAESAGLFRTYMSRLETGLANPTFDVLLSLADALNVQPAALFDIPAAPPGPGRSRKGPRN